MADRITPSLGLVVLDTADVPYGYNERVEADQNQFQNFTILDTQIASMSLASSRATTGSVNFWVTSSGSDSNPGTQALPFLTIQKAYDSFPKDVCHTCSISLGPGNYQGALVAGFNFYSLPGSTAGAYIQLIGSLSASSAPGVTTGTLTSATAGSDSTVVHATAFVSGANWVPDQFRNSYLRIVAGTGAGQLRPIASNSLDTLTLPGGGFSGNATSVFEIVDMASNVNVAMPHQESSLAAFLLFANQGGVNTLQQEGNDVQSIIFQQLNITTPYAVINSSDASTLIRQCSYTGRILNTQNGASTDVMECSKTGATSWIINESDSSIKARRCVVTSPGSPVFDFRWGMQAFLFGNVITQPSNVCLSLTNISGPVIVEGTRIIRNTVGGTGVSVNNSNQRLSTVTLTGCELSNFTTAIRVDGPSSVVLSNVTGSGNTTCLTLTKGADVQVNAATTLTGTTDFTLDGVAQTFANMRAQGTRILSHPDYGTRVYE